MDPKEIRKQRTLIYFIEATQALIEEEGIDNLTIRKIAARAGYNSATLYHYFDNLDQLITYASLKHISLYNREFAESVTDNMTERQKFILMWIFLFARPFCIPMRLQVYSCISLTARILQKFLLNTINYSQKMPCLRQVQFTILISMLL